MCVVYLFIFLVVGVGVGQSADMLIKLNNVPCTKFSVRDENCIRTRSNDALVFSQSHPAPRTFSSGTHTLLP